DENDRAAVSPFCAEVRRKIQELGYFHGTAYERLRDLAVQYECCDWIKDENDRVARKTTIGAEMDAFCRKHPVNKQALLKEQRTGSYIALASAISANPEQGDVALLLDIRQELLPRGFAYYRILDAAAALAKVSTPE